MDSFRPKPQSLSPKLPVFSDSKFLWSMISGWCNNHLEKWWSSSMGRMTSHIWNGQYNSCLKPPTRYSWILYKYRSIIVIHILSKISIVRWVNTWNLRLNRFSDWPRGQGTGSSHTSAKRIQPLGEGRHGTANHIPKASARLTTWLNIQWEIWFYISIHIYIVNYILYFNHIVSMCIYSIDIFIRKASG